MSTRIYYKLGQHWYPPSPSVRSSIVRVEVQCMRWGSVNSPETLGMTETLIASVRFHQWPTFLLMSGPHFLTHHQASLKEESWRWKEKVIWMKNEVWELRVYFWWSGGETTFFSVLLCLLFVLMPARTCQSWYKMYVLQQTHKHIYARRWDHVILRSAVFAFHLNA